MIRENPASRGTETSAEVLVGPPWRMESNAGQQTLNYLSHHLAAISMAAVYTDAAHIADGVIGLKQRSL